MYKRKPSNVWNHFVDRGEKAECKLCSKAIKKCGNTSNFMAHLRNIHNILPNQMEVIQHQDLDANSQQEIQPTIILQLHQPATLNKINGQKDQQTNQQPSKRSRASDDREEKARQLVNSITSWLAKDMLPEDIVSGEGFQKFFHDALPQYSIPSHSDITQKLQSKFQNSLVHVADKLSRAADLAISVDCWDNPLTNRSCITLTCHFIESQRHESIVIGTRDVDKTQAGNPDELHNAIMDILNRWNIQRGKITCSVTGDISNLESALKDIIEPGKRQHCFALTLHSLVRDAIKENVELIAMIGKVKEILRFSDEITQAQESVIKDQIVVVQVTTKDTDKGSEVEDWNGLYIMLDRFINQGHMIAGISMTYEGPEMILDGEQKTLEEILALLKPFHQIAIEMSGERWTPISKVIPIVGVLVKAINLVLPESACAKEFKNTLLKSIRTNFKDIESDPIVSIATLLDPRFKNLDFSNEAHSVKAVNKLNSMIVPSSGSIEETNAEENKKDDSDDIWCLRRVTRTIKCDTSDSNRMALEVKNYLDHKTFQLTSDPIDIWENQKHLFPNIYKLAMKFLAIPASSVPAERLFTNAGSLVNQKRCLLDPNHIENLLILESLPIDVVFSL